MSGPDSFVVGAPSCASQDGGGIPVHSPLGVSRSPLTVDISDNRNALGPESPWLRTDSPRRCCL